MKIIMGPSGSGKTKEIIDISHKTGYYIVCNSHKESSRIAKVATKMGKRIPFPITYYEFTRQRYGPFIRGFLIDNVDMMVESMTPFHVGAISMRKADDHKWEEEWVDQMMKISGS